jgi:hypothetical protein
MIVNTPKTKNGHLHLFFAPFAYFKLHCFNFVALKLKLKRRAPQASFALTSLLLYNIIMPILDSIASILAH